ncbi:MAG TPA: NUDIX domain-containing protein [Paenalcaligenes sp.]|nr:NUDIX domain-containing protein [Paenalcaligenes sp.]
MPRTLFLAVALMHDPAGRVLFVRKNPFKHYMLAGGKIEDQEDAISALTRELYEELCVSVPAYLPQLIGTYSAPAANEKGYVVQAQLFKLFWPYPVQVGAEIAEAHWFHPGQSQDINLAPLARNVVQSGLLHCF